MFTFTRLKVYSCQTERLEAFETSFGGNLFFGGGLLFIDMFGSISLEIRNETTEELAF
jgi:hypothetical protein